MSRSGLITLLTDFGPSSVYVGQMHGAVLRAGERIRAWDGFAQAPLWPVRVVDLAHDCPFANIEAAAYILDRSYRHFPAGTVHVAVVDPGVGSDRAIVAASAFGHLFVAPDNGLLHPVLEAAAEGTAASPRVYRVENRDLMSETISNTFHGRDIFAPVAAFLAAGCALEEVGPPTTPQSGASAPAIRDGVLQGKVLLVDRFGNLITNLPRDTVTELAGAHAIRVRIGAAFIDRVVETFADVEMGVALVYFGSGNHLEIAVNGGRAADVLGFGVDTPVRVERRSA